MSRTWEEDSRFQANFSNLRGKENPRVFIIINTRRNAANKRPRFNPVRFERKYNINNRLEIISWIRWLNKPKLPAERWEGEIVDRKSERNGVRDSVFKPNRRRLTCREALMIECFWITFIFNVFFYGLLNKYWIKY